MPKFDLDLIYVSNYGDQHLAVKEPLVESNIFCFDNEDDDDQIGVTPKAFNFPRVEVNLKGGLECEEKYQSDLDKNFNSIVDESQSEIAEPIEAKLKIKSKSFSPKTRSALPVKEIKLDSLSAKQKKKKVLALRADVMNKNLFRAIRRECKAIYEGFLKKNGLSNSRSKRIFKSNLRKFSEHLLNSTNVEWKSRCDFNTAEFSKHLGLFINTCLMKKVLDEKVGKDLITEFNNLLYSYSHKKFYEYLSVWEVSAVIKIIFECAEVKGFVSNHPTLTVNQEEYEDHIEKILSHI